MMLSEFIKMFEYELPDAQTSKYIADSIRAAYPGDYDVTVTYDGNGKMTIEFEFEEEEDATAFKLTYGG